MDNLATPVEMVDDIMKYPEQMPSICAEAFNGLLMMANMLENEKTTCYQQVG
ncbi:hypothetical protein BRE01_26910 [Brevibacillus reuszeri]|uniref:Uncharacterized protein n=1 Tax=Brevibacillus reuszeri TaxID=54915 RepID=A0ABQ0TM69_9BACL|nr:hypothetical protein [Brevibacillus reuszeri]MED1858020.1 hypothetical protein [Brevibacillus reuszeri]GED68989.1 hypothetical protein BRE01_26910 [Brevibacillus reuszeri]